MSGSPKFSAITYSAARLEAQQCEHRERERLHRLQVEERRRRAEAIERRQQACRSAGLLAAIDAELAHLKRGAQFAPVAAAGLDRIAERVEAARLLHENSRFAEAETEIAQLQPGFAAMRLAVEQEAERLALRVATVDALSMGLRTRGYEVGDVLAQGDGTVALRAELAGIAGIDLAVVDSESGDELVLQRHDARTPTSGATTCPSLVALHADLQSELETSGIELGDLRWNDPSAEAEERIAPTRPHQSGRSA
jgi:hypothetical protein